MKFLLMVLQEKQKHHKAQRSDHVVLHKVPMVHYIFVMIRKGEFGKYLINRAKKMKYLLSVVLLTISLMMISWKPVKGPKGKKTYDRICSGCHNADARGIPGFSPALSGSKIVLGSKPQLIRVLLKGSAELKNIPGHG